MLNRLLAPTILFLATFGSVYGGEPGRAAYLQLKRLHTVLELPSFPVPTQAGVQIWQQETNDDGTAVTFDLDKIPVDSRSGKLIRQSLRDEITLHTIVQFCGGIGMRNDLENIVVISNSGRSIQFVNFKKPAEQILVKRGDVVAFLRSEDAQ